MIDLAFIGGVHAVGKTTFCESIIKKANYTHIIASQLIREQGEVITEKNTKAVQDIKHNQKVLIKALAKYQTAGGQRLLIDGHFTLLLPSGEVEKIDAQIFTSISPQLVVVLYDDPLKIAARYNQRDNFDVPLEQIIYHQTIEIKHAKEISKNLNIPFLKLLPNEKSLQRLLAELVK